jgi:hypothetical protein
MLLELALPVGPGERGTGLLLDASAEICPPRRRCPTRGAGCSRAHFDWLSGLTPVRRRWRLPAVPRLARDDEPISSARWAGGGGGGGPVGPGIGGVAGRNRPPRDPLRARPPPRLPGRCRTAGSWRTPAAWGCPHSGTPNPFPHAMSAGSPEARYGILDLAGRPRLSPEWRCPMIGRGRRLRGGERPPGLGCLAPERSGLKCGKIPRRGGWRERERRNRPRRQRPHRGGSRLAPQGWVCRGDCPFSRSRSL